MTTLTTLHNRLVRLEARRATTSQRGDVVVLPSLDAAKMRDILTRLVEMGVFAPDMLLQMPQMLKLRELALQLGMLAARASDQPLSIRVLCRIRLDDLLAGASDLVALERIVAWPAQYPEWHVELRALDNVHAKVWVCDARIALISSGNATPSGLNSNVEYGVELRDTSLITQVLADWHSPWEHATSIVSEDLVPFRQVLDHVSQDRELREAQAVAKRRQAELAEISGVPSRLGSTLHLQPRAGESSTLPSAPTRSTPQHVGQVGPAQPITANGSSDLDPALELRLDHLWQAIGLIFPMEHGAFGYRVQLDPAHVLKLSCEPQDIQDVNVLEKPVRLSLLRLIWANGIRDVTAPVPAFVQYGNEKAPIRGPWAVSLNAQAIQQLLRVLNSYETYQPGGVRGASSYKEVRFHIDLSRLQLRVEGWQITSIDNEQKEALVLGDSTNITVVPAPMETGLGSIADPIAEAQVHRDDLWHALWELDHSNSTMRANSRDAQEQIQEPVVEIHIHGDRSPVLVVDTVHRERHRGKRVPLTDARFTGPSVTLRLDRAALNQMLRTGQWQWMTMRMGKDADVIQFELEAPLDGTPVYPPVRWFYQLRSLE